MTLPLSLSESLRLSLSLVCHSYHAPWLCILAGPRGEVLFPCATCRTFEPVTEELIFAPLGDEHRVAALGAFSDERTPASRRGRPYARRAIRIIFLVEVEIIDS